MFISSIRYDLCYYGYYLGYYLKIINLDCYLNYCLAGNSSDDYRLERLAVGSCCQWVETFSEALALTIVECGRLLLLNEAVVRFLGLVMNHSHPSTKHQHSSL